ncbi:HlyD family secretion protein [Aequitasia blattaphilus]|uniref:Efflux RND transporter periplasmic adaptor subunit n=1 Tax=Aequitasia blattaphilus TaxID=2949332 RepID=A0ABT1EBY3_9FIRM|nr:efflux RND transporter periplasmic adaptor subunit [Aequitasia blattaphilus]MCP1102452.1 efflux RND transporter periplasmic adaptor subunit [Aequitasia blattaphilus]MCR8615092.1 efflux RND transporter periplasmic adaptor subunit [Aequitasia blattaphilus]
MKKEELEKLDIVEEEVLKKKKKLPGWVIIPIIVVVFGVVVLIASLMGGDSKGQGTSLDVVKIKEGTVEETFETSGTVDSERKKTFYSPVNAPISSPKLEVGKLVKAGDVLVTFDTKDLEKNNQESNLQALSTQYTNQATKEQAAKTADASARQSAKLEEQKQKLRDQIASKQAEITDMENRMTESNVNNASIMMELENVRIDLETNAAQIQQEKVNKENEELKALVEKDATLAATYTDNAKKSAEKIIELEQGKSDLEAYQNELNAQLSTGDAEAIQAASKEVEALQTSLSELEGQDTTTDAGITSGQINQMAVSEDLSRLASMTTEELLQTARNGIKAEFDGIISKVDTQGGGMATQGIELFTLVDTKAITVRVEVSANDFSKLETGNAASVRIGKNKYKGIIEKVDRIATQNEKGNSVLGATVKITNADENIFIGVPAKVSVSVAKVENALYLPSEIINESKSGSFVYMIEGGKVKKVIVETGVNSGSNVEIVKGLEKDAQVVYDTSGSVKEGMSATAVLVEDK